MWNAVLTLRRALIDEITAFLDPAAPRSREPGREETSA
jgi:hypothetical protein